jgi:hypothetical protein
MGHDTVVEVLSADFSVVEGWLHACPPAMHKHK